MIDFLEGIVAEKRLPSELVIAVSGVGFRLACSTRTLADAPAIGAAIRIHTRMIVREDAMELLGFMTPDERSMFDQLRSVTGIGIRTALAMQSVMSATEIRRAITLSDAAALARAPGVGKKTAQRLILELKDKAAASAEEADAAALSTHAGLSADREAIAGMMSLGYTASEAAKAVAAAMEGQSGQTSEAIILRALKRINA